jgi:amino acid transporter
MTDLFLSRENMPEQITLKRSMSLSTLTFYGLGTIIGAGIYVLIGEVAGVSGALMPWSFLLAGIIAGFTGLSYAELASRYPFSAGEAVYVNNAWHKNWLTAVVGWMIIFTGIVSAAAISKGFAGYVNVFIELDPVWAISLLCIALCGIAIYGINLSAGTVFIITLLELIGLAYVAWITFGMEAIEPLELSSEYSNAGLNGLLLGAFLAFYAFIGFEDMVNVIEEVRNPIRNITIAIVLAISLSALCYVGISYLVLQVVAPASLAQSEAPLADLVAMAGFDPAFIGMISLLAVINGALVQIVMASRVMYGMTKLNLAPTLLGYINGLTRTPVFATLLVSILVLGFALLLPLVRLAQLTSLIMLMVFATVNLALIVIKLRQEVPSSGLNIPILIPGMGVLSSVLLIWYQLQSQLL